jgi:two-component system phosphate regulon sensor histidine kinase PhoR
MLLRKLILAALLLIAVTLGSTDFFLTRQTAAREFQHATEIMEAQAALLTASLAQAREASLAEWARQAAARTHTRVTVISRDGAVLADSEHDSTSMDNHAGRPEIRVALAGRTGTSVRHSATLDVDLCYFAVPAATAGNTPVILRLALPLERVATSIAEIRWIIFRASLVAGLVALIVALLVSRRFTKRIHQIQAFAGELVKADYSGTLSVESDDELGSVARSLRSMADQFRETMQKLSNEAARRNAILSSMVEGVLAVDQDLRITFCNESFTRAIRLGSTPREGLPLVEVVRDPDLLELMKGVLATGEPARTRLSILAARGRVFDTQAAVLGSGPRRGAIAILHDVTEVEHLERVRKDFVANMSHELRTPLAAIRGYAETLLDNPPEDPGQSRRFLEVIYSNAKRLGDMSSDLLTLSELEWQRESLPAERVKIFDAVRTAVESVRHEAESREIRIVVGDTSDLSIHGQAFRLEHALMNLLQNAIRYNRRGGEVRVDAVRAGTDVRICVCDTGIGIPTTDLPRIFERFYCVDKARSRQTGGTGLGLSIVKHLAERLGGAVTVQSELGKGSTFTLQFPAAEEQPKTAVS